MRIRWAQALAVAAALAGPTSASYAFDWIGKIELYAGDLDSPDAEARLDAVRKLARSEIAWAKPHLVRALADSDVRVRIAAGKALARARVKAAVPIVIGWLSEADRTAQKAAADILGEIGDERAVGPLIRSIGDPDAQVRVSVVSALGRIGGNQVVVPLINRLEDDKSEVRRSAVEQLLRIGDRRAVIPLVGLFDDGNPDVQVAAIGAVGRLGDRAALPALERLLRDRDEKIKVAAVAALGHLGAHEAADTLLDLFDTGSSNFRAKVAYALGQIARSSTSAEHRERALQALVEALANGQLRSAAREALLAADDAAVPYLIAHLEGKLDGDPATAVILLREIGDERATAALIAELDRSRLARQLVLEALAAIGDDRALIPVLGLLSDKDADVRLAAMHALEPMIAGNKRAADILIGMLDDPELDIRVLAAQFLGQMGSRQPVPRLLELTADGTARLRAAAIAALGEIGDPRAAPRLLELLRDGPNHLRQDVADALIYIRSKDTVKPLLEQIADSGDRFRATRVRVLGGVLRDRKHGRARQTLHSLATDAPLDVSLAAIAAIGSMADPASADRLRQVIRESNLERRRAAITALANVAGSGDQETIALLTEQLRSTDDRIAGAAAWALGQLDGKSALPALERSLRRRGFAAPINASAALVAMAEHANTKTLRAMLDHPIRFVRANGAEAIGRVGMSGAKKRLRYMLEQDSSWLARLAAARALSRLGGADKVLARAAKDDPRPEVRAAAKRTAGEPFAPPARTEWRELHVVDPTDGDRAVRQEAYFVAAPDGIITALYTDSRGRAVIEKFPPGEVIAGSAANKASY